MRRGRVYKRDAPRTYVQEKPFQQEESADELIRRTLEAALINCPLEFRPAPNGRSEWRFIKLS